MFQGFCPFTTNDNTVVLYRLLNVRYLESNGWIGWLWLTGRRSIAACAEVGFADLVQGVVEADGIGVGLLVIGLQGFELILLGGTLLVVSSKTRRGLATAAAARKETRENFMLRWL